MLVLIVDGCEVVEGGVATLAVVDDLDEVEHRSPQGLAAWPVVAVEELTLQGGEEALGHRVVQRVADGALEATRPAALSRRPKDRLVYWQPWSR
jgi:hypothetical protein